jgi:quinol monooxygenase YgiN
MSEVRLTGRLICSTPDEARVVAAHLPRHVALTRAEHGCLAFDVTPTADGLTWQVEERFVNEAAFIVHQDRVAGSEWGRMTAGIERRYSTEGLSR